MTSTLKVFAIDRGDGQLAWQPFTDGSERPLIFDTRSTAKREALYHNAAFPGSEWKPIPVTISWDVK